MKDSAAVSLSILSPHVASVSRPGLGLTLRLVSRHEMPLLYFASEWTAAFVSVRSQDAITTSTRHSYIYSLVATVCSQKTTLMLHTMTSTHINRFR